MNRSVLGCEAVAGGGVRAADEPGAVEQQRVHPFKRAGCAGSSAASSHRFGRPAGPRIMAERERVVALIDLDCFYCACERHLEPSLVGVPIAVV